MPIYEIRVEDINNRVVHLDEFRGKVLLIVNTATKCFYTPQYEGLQKIYDKYKDQGFEILDFPSNQFLNQAPESNKEIDDFCVNHFNTSFKRFQKVDVNGKEESILYTFLKSKAPGLFNRDIKWNFTKFLIDQEGNVVKRYSPRVKPERIAKDIAKLLQKNVQNQRGF